MQLARYAGAAGAQKRCPGLAIQLHIVLTFLERGIAVQGVERRGLGRANGLCGVCRVSVAVDTLDVGVADVEAYYEGRRGVILSGHRSLE